jgi:hypothetical protein
MPQTLLHTKSHSSTVRTDFSLGGTKYNDWSWSLFSSSGDEGSMCADNCNDISELNNIAQVRVDVNKFL